FGTDHPVYLRHAVMVMRRHAAAFEWLVDAPASWQTRPAGWIETRHEAKARRLGHEVWYFRYRRRESRPRSPSGPPRAHAAPRVGPGPAAPGPVGARRGLARRGVGFGGRATRRCGCACPLAAAIGGNSRASLSP